MKKTYLGDAVYADFDGYYIVLTTEDGIRVTNIVCLEPQVFDALVEYRHALDGTQPDTVTPEEK